MKLNRQTLLSYLTPQASLLTQKTLIFLPDNKREEPQHIIVVTITVEPRVRVLEEVEGASREKKP